MRHRTRLVLAVIFLLAVVLRLVLMVHFRTYVIPAERNHFAFGYEAGRVAMSLAEGGTYSSPMPEPTGPTAWFAPLFPLILGGIFKIFGIYSPASAVAIYSFNILCAGASCLLAYWAAGKVFGRMVGLASAAVLAVYPASIWYAIGTVWDTSLLACELLLLAGMLLRLDEDSGTRAVLGCGALMGLILLTNPVPAIVYPFLVAWYLWKTWGRKHGIRHAAILVLTPALVFGPWVVRNYLVVGALTPRCCLGLELMLTNNELSWQQRRTSFVLSMHPTVSQTEFALYKQMGEPAYNRYSMSRATEFMRANPGKTLGLMMLRIQAWWLGEASEYTAHLHTSARLGPMKRAVVLLPLPFLVLGIIRAVRSRLAIHPLVGILLIYPLPYYLSNINERMKFPVQPIALIVATYGLAWFVRRRAVEALRSREAEAVSV